MQRPATRRLKEWYGDVGDYDKAQYEGKNLFFFPLYSSLCRLYVVPAALSNVLSNALSAAFVLCCKMFQ